MRFRVGIACGVAILGPTLLLACFPDFYFYDKVEHDSGGPETSAGDAGLDARPLRDDQDAADDVPDPLDALDAFDAFEAADALDADVDGD